MWVPLLTLTLSLDNVEKRVGVGQRTEPLTHMDVRLTDWTLWLMSEWLIRVVCSVGRVYKRTSFRLPTSLLFGCRSFLLLDSPSSSDWRGPSDSSSRSTSWRPPVSSWEACLWFWLAGPSLEWCWRSTVSFSCSGQRQQTHRGKYYRFSPNPHSSVSEPGRIWESELSVFFC